jgi:hypothetical protein
MYRSSHRGVLEAFIYQMITEEVTNNTIVLLCRDDPVLFVNTVCLIIR